MGQVVTLEGFTPADRYDGNPWTNAQIEEGDTSDGPWTLIDTIALSPVDTDPSEPAARSFTTTAASETPALWYRIIFLDGLGNDTLPTEPVQNSSPDGTTPYASVDELARILKIRNPTTEQHAAMERVLQTAAGEINSEIDLDDDTSLSGWQLSLAAEVNLERAVEHWQQMESPFGIIGLGADLGPTHTATDSWNRHAAKLAPLKSQWGFS